MCQILKTMETQIWTKNMGNDVDVDVIQGCIDILLWHPKL